MDPHQLPHREKSETSLTYQVITKNKNIMKNMNFGEAIEALKQGKRVARAGWNGKGMFIYLTPGGEVTKARDNALDVIIKAKGSCKINSHIDMKAADDSIVCGWLVSQTDMLAEDWMIFE